MKILLDTNFIVSYILPNDSLHYRSVVLDEKYNFESKKCYVSNQIITEVMNILGQKDSVSLALDTYFMLNDCFNIINEYEIPDFNDEVLTTYKSLNRKNAKHKLGFTDCAIITTAKLYNIDAIVTFDKEFLKNDVINIIH